MDEEIRELVTDFNVPIFTDKQMHWQHFPSSLLASPVTDLCS